MADIGLCVPAIAPITNENTETGELTYGSGCLIGKAIKCDINPTYAEASLYADNGEAENVKELTKADVTLGTSTIPIESLPIMFDATVSGETGEENIDFASGDNAPYVGFGIIKTEMVEGIKKFALYWLHKVKFVPPSESFSTQGESITFATPSISGKAVPINNPDSKKRKWKNVKYYKTASEAIAALKEKCGITTATAAASETSENTSNESA